MLRFRIRKQRETGCPRCPCTSEGSVLRDTCTMPEQTPCSTAPLIDDLSDTDGRRTTTNSLASISFRQILDHWTFRLQYEGEQDLPLVMELVDNELSEPYSIFTYRFFLQHWPRLCWLVFDKGHCFGVVVSKQEKHGELLRGYIAMLVVQTKYRGLGVGTELVKRSIQEMIRGEADEVVLEAETTNRGALALYQNLGFIRDKYLRRYYLSGSDAFRLKLMLPLPPARLKELQDEQIVAEELAQMRLRDVDEASNGNGMAQDEKSMPMRTADEITGSKDGNKIATFAAPAAKLTQQTPERRTPASDKRQKKATSKKGKKKSSS